MTEYTRSMERIHGYVAQILNARELVINIGEEDGVQESMKFAVLSSEKLPIFDPQTNELLDEIDGEKVRVEAIKVRPKVTICKTYRSRHVPASPFYVKELDIGSWGRPPESVPETLTTRESDYPEPLPTDERYVKVGDRVVEVEE